MRSGYNILSSESIHIVVIIIFSCYAYCMGRRSVANHYLLTLQLMMFDECMSKITSVGAVEECSVNTLKSLLAILITCALIVVGISIV